jgi:CRP-like cAMP-binding protein
MLQKGKTGDGTPPGFFLDLGDKERITLFNTGTIRTLTANELLFKKGTPGKTIFCLLSGTLRVESGDSYTPVLSFKPGDLIAETGLSAGDGRISSVVAKEASAVFSLDRAAFDTLGGETQTAILKRLHDTALSGMEVLGKQKESAQLRGAALTRYIKKSRKHLGKYEQIASELCQSYDKNRSALLSTVALLHDIGATVLLLLRKQNPKWTLFTDTLDPFKLGAMLLKQWNIPREICQTIEHQAYPAFCHPSGVPSGQRVNVALLYVSHAVYDHLSNGRVDALDHPFLDDYLRLIRFDSCGIDQISKDYILRGLRTKSHRLPEFIRKRLALIRFAER